MFFSNTSKVLFIFFSFLKTMTNNIYNIYYHFLLFIHSTFFFPFPSLLKIRKKKKGVALFVGMTSLEKFLLPCIYRVIFLFFFLLFFSFYSHPLSHPPSFSPLFLPPPSPSSPSFFPLLLLLPLRAFLMKKNLLLKKLFLVFLLYVNYVYFENKDCWILFIKSNP